MQGHFSLDRVDGTYPFLVAAHGRSGTHYAASLLQSAGLRVGHECYGPDGVVSWLHVGKGEIAGRAVDPERTTYGTIIHLVRHPLNVISSSTTMMRISFEFMRDNLKGHALPAVTEDMVFEDKVRFLSRTWIEWNRKIECMGPAYQVKAEDLPPGGQKYSRRALYGRPLTEAELQDICGSALAIEVLDMARKYGYHV